MSSGAPRGAEWHWLWMVYVVGVCAAAMFAVVVLDHRFPGNIPVAISAIAGMMLCVVILGRRVFVLPENSWGAVLFVGSVVALWTLALWASPVAVAAVPTIYPLVFATLTLRAALVITTAINLIPVTLVIAREGIRSPNLGIAIAFTLIGVIIAPVVGTVIITSMRQRRQLGGTGGRTRCHSRRERPLIARGGHRRRTGATGARDTRHPRSGFHQRRHARTSHRTRAGNRYRGGEKTHRVDRRHSAGEPRRGSGDGGRTYSEPLEEPLPAAIQRQCDRLAAETDAAVTVRIADDLPPQSMASDVVLLRAAQEAFANIRKHAHASTVTVSCRPRNQESVLR